MRFALTLLLAAGLALCAVAQADVVDLEPVPALTHSRQLLQTADDGSYGYGGGYGGRYGGGYSYGAGNIGRRRLIESGSYGGYGYGDDGQYGYGDYGYGRRLEEILLQPVDPLLEYAAEHQEEQQQHQQPWQEQKQEQKQGKDSNGLSAAAAAALHQARTNMRNSKALQIPVGSCYCRYDTDFNIWALAEDSCKQALYKRCKTEKELECIWLDEFYAPVHGPAHQLPHEKDIAAFMYEDCSPQPPCACSGLNFDGTDAVPIAVACCRDLKVACKTPFSGLACKQVSEFCEDDKPAPVLAAWSSHMLRHADCSSYTGIPYKIVPLEKMQAAVQQQNTESASPDLLMQALNSLKQQPTSSNAAAWHPGGFAASGAMIVIVAGAMCMAVVAVLFAMRTETHSVIESDTDSDTGDDNDYSNVTNPATGPVGSVGLLSPVGSAPYSGVSSSLPCALMPMPSIMSEGRVSAGGSIQEPLLPQSTVGIPR
eukprot:GHRR01002570.1.p1 GENE.GHRR01002570.1~~GHRR01002570.1.p1  ORF type:complete len:483 (+),score=159.54 GHRR01002570.1:316-1764(+)